MEECKPVFVYGSLMEGQYNSRVLNGLEVKREQGQLEGYDLFDTRHGYPAILTGEGRVYGEVLHFTEEEYEDALLRLDRLEGYFAPKEEHSLYLRRSVVITVKGGKSVECWVYVWNRSRSGLEQVQEGDWREFKVER
jgi:gamma-glutamylcyclotransferase (GGCT)/AIG2-like uncharacterized protein YtfP